MRDISKEGLTFIERWEEFVPYVYDDKVRKRKINGVLQYPEWDGSKPIGTLTIGYGHTDAAGYPHIKLGLRVSKEQADEILDDDLKDCKASVNSTVKVPLTQHQYDALVSFTFNCGAGNLKKLVVDLNKKIYDTMPRKLMQYVSSKGQRMQGLVNRRSAEVRMWDTPDLEADADSMVQPKAEREDPPKTIATSKSGNAALLTGAGGASVVLSQASDISSTLKDVKGNFADLGVFDILGQALHTPMFWVGVVIIAAAGFIYWDRHRKLSLEHV